MKYIRGSVLLVVSFVGSLGGVWARVNMVETWSPGFDAHISENKWNNSLHAGVGNGGADGTDSTELGYALTTPLGDQWEVAGTWGIATLDSSGVRNDSGLTDLTFAAKRRLPGTLFPKKVKAVGEFGISLPTGDPDHGIGAGGLGFLANAGLSLPIQSVRGYAQIGLKMFTEGSGTRWGNTLNYSAGAMYSLRPEWMLSADLRVITHAKDKINGTVLPDARQEAYLAPGGVWIPTDGPLEAQGLLLLGLTGDSYDFGIQLGIRY
ncbi:MAG: hypothetical protein IPN90_10600 [Elusimicrobia bacterium]|nr:hypothetical protein [Elusimicrobiota bacterium]